MALETFSRESSLPNGEGHPRSRELKGLNPPKNLDWLRRCSPGNRALTKHQVTWPWGSCALARCSPEGRTNNRLSQASGFLDQVLVNFSSSDGALVAKVWRKKTFLLRRVKRSSGDRLAATCGSAKKVIPIYYSCLEQMIYSLYVKMCLIDLPTYGQISEKKYIQLSKA